MKTLAFTLVVMPLLASTAGAEPEPQFARDLALSPTIGASAAAATLSETFKPRLKLALTLSDPGPAIEAIGLRPSESIVTPTDAAAFEVQDNEEQSGPATR